jgi:hypothetical protein
MRNYWWRYHVLSPKDHYGVALVLPFNSINISTKSKKDLWRCTHCKKTWDNDEINMEKFTAHNIARLKQKNKRYKNHQEPKSVVKIDGN